MQQRRECRVGIEVSVKEGDEKAEWKGRSLGNSAHAQNAIRSR